MKTLFTKEEITDLLCCHCGKDLLNPPNGHLLINDQWNEDRKQTRIIDILWLCCSCDKHRSTYRRWGWKDIHDLFIPEVLIQWLLGVLEALHTQSQTFSDEAMEKLMKLLLIIFPHISKKITPEQRKILETLHAIPRCIGGLGND
jgi:hypothetical protein